MAMDRVLLDLMARLDGLATSARFGNSPEVERLQKELRDELQKEFQKQLQKQLQQEL